MSYGKKLNTAATAVPKLGDKLLMVQDGQIKTVPVTSYSEGVPMMVGIPTVEAMIDGGYMPVGTGHNNYEEYMKGMVKYLKDKFPQGGLFLGTVEPGVRGFYMAFIYPNSDMVDGMPRYSIGQLIPFSTTSIKLFSTNDYQFSYREIM